MHQRACHYSTDRHSQVLGIVALSVRAVLGCVLGLLTAPCVCAQTCPSAATGNCFTPHPTPGCQDPTCCAAVCQVDSFCCTTTWDGQCAVIAGSVCQPPPPVNCGAAGLGDCFVAHSTPGCNVPSCCSSVCELLPTCCSVTWDATCVSSAFQLCPPVCVPQCPPNSSTEIENCDTSGFGNDPCPLGTAGSGFQSLVANKAMCGDIKFVSAPGSTVGVPERDAFRITLPDPDGNGQARVSLSLLAERGTADSGTVPLFVALIRNACDGLQTAVLHAQIVDCQSASVQGCVPAGDWLAVVARGSYPLPETYPFNCLSGVQSYVLTASWNDQCGSACGTSGNCYAVHSTPGCADSSCCNSVCAAFPDCCSESWDQSCVTSALTVCSPTNPANDTCASAMPLGLGSANFALVTATPSSIAAPSDCLATGQSLGRDVWYRLRGLRGEVTVTTCGPGTFDSALLLYGNTCPTSPASAVACGNSNPDCTQNTSSAVLNFNATCGEEYLLRVAGVGTVQGGGTLTITAALPACVACAADLNGDSQVNGSDLTALLSAWGATGAADINGDGVVSGADLTELLSRWGACP